MFLKNAERKIKIKKIFTVKAKENAGKPELRRRNEQNFNEFSVIKYSNQTFSTKYISFVRFFQQKN